MKNLFLSTFIILIIQISYSQNDTNTSVKEKEIFNYVEIGPSWRGCENIPAEEKRGYCTEESVKRFISENLIYPKTSLTKKIEGTVYINFTINSDGIVSTPKILRGINEEMDAEALRVINLMPQWYPGKHKGEAVAVQYNYPIKFSLQE